MPPTAPLLIMGGLVDDGSGAHPVHVDVLVERGRVARVEPQLLPPPGAEVVDARGLELLPGFVDVHAHDDAALFRPGALEPKVRQGVTTTVIGNCGHGCAPSGTDRSLEDYSTPVLGPFPPQRWSRFGDYLAELAARPLGLNTVALVPHAPVRAAELGFDTRPADAAEVDRITGAVGEALDAGAAGVSLGLMYAPGSAADRTELVAIARTVAARGKLLVAHVRNEADDLLDSLAEFADLGRASGAALHVSHLKVTGPRNVGRMPEAIEALDALRSEGIDVTADVYPYEAGSTTVATLFPSWATDRGVASLLTTLVDPGGRAAVLTGLREPWSGPLENYFASIGPTAIALAGFGRPEHAGFEGRSIADLAVARGQEPAECLIDLVLAEAGTLTVVLFQTDLAGMEHALAWPHTLVGSDGLPREQGYVHPRLYGTFSRVLIQYAGPGRVLTRTEAVHRMSVAAALRFGRPGPVGVVPGAAADLQLIDPLAYADRATYETPRRHPTGLVGVWIRGRRVIGDGIADEVAAGRFVPVA